MADFLDVKRKEIQNRLTELKPLVEEYSRLEMAVAALSGVNGGRPRATTGPRATTTTTTRRRPGRPRRGSAPTTARTPARRGRRRGGNTRATEALELVRTQPGITIPELAGKMGIKQNYLYRVLPGLQKEGLVSKSGRGWHVKK